MANLETLEITINANAESASQGLSNLINSLTALSKKVGKTVGALKQLNTQLSTLKGFSNIKFTGIEKAAKDVKSAVDIPSTKLEALEMKLNGVTEAMEKAAGKGNKLSVANKRLQQFNIEKQIKKETEAINSRTDAIKNQERVTSNYKDNIIWDEEKRRAMNPQWYVDYDSPEGKAMIAARNEALQKRGESLPIASDKNTLNQFKGAINSKLIENLNKKADYSNFGDFINQQLGIGVKPKSAKSSALAFLKHDPSLLNQEVDYSHLGEFINRKLGIGEKPKSAKDSASVFMEQMKDTPTLAERAKKAFTSFRDGVKNFGKEVGNVLPKFNALHKVMRIASTMLIRTGIRTLFKGITEGVGNYYQYSKNIGSEFASVADQLSSSWATLKNQMGASIAPALSAAIPVINSLASAATTAFNALSQLFALLTGKGSWSKATTQVQAFDAAAKKAGGGGGGVSELLAKFDELNVIARESGGGGGGGGAAEDFANMFEEIYDFDSRIRDVANFIRETIDWVRENFDVLLISAGLIGTAILGWKLSKAFEGFMSDLGKYIAGGALISLGVVLDFDFGRKAGAAMSGGEALNFGDIVEGVAGIIAAGIGGYVIGGGVGAAVGLGITITATIAGVIIGAVNQNEANKWGKVNLTSDELKEYVKSKFKFDVFAEVEVLEANIKNARAAKAHLDGAISEFGRKIDKIKLGVDSTKAVEDAIAALDDVKTAVNDYLEKTGSLMDAMFKITPSNVTAQIETDLQTADAELKRIANEAGEKVSKLYDEGMKTGWKNNEQEQIKALLEHNEKIFAITENDKAYAKFLSSSKLNLKDLTANNIREVLDMQKEELASFEKAIDDSTQIAYESMLARALWLENAGYTDLAETMRADAEKLVEVFKNANKEKLQMAKEELKKDWIKQLSEVYDSDATTAVAESTGNTFIRNMQKAVNVNKDWEKVKEVAQKALDQTLGKLKFNNKILAEAADLFGITGWELLGKEAKTKYFNALYKAINGDSVQLLKEMLSLNASEIIEISGWDTFTTEQKTEFIRALQKSFGSTEALLAAKEAGIDVVSAINEGLSSKNADTKKAAEGIVSEIQATLDKLGIKINASADLEVAVKALVEYQLVENAKAQIQKAKASVAAPKISLGNKYDSKVNMAYASGGFPSKGDVFIANEQTAELVGSINGRTAVANQEQIIMGIQRGVSEANNEQNALLRQQNDLLRSILEKENVVRFGASAAFGRTAKQSINMYNSMVGG